MTQLIPQQLNRWRLAIFVCICLLSISSTVSLNVTLKIEDPKIERSNAKLDYLGVETFDESEQLVNDTYETKFGNATGPISGTYDQLYLIQRTGTRGTGDRGMFAVAWEDQFYTLVLTSAGDIGINYFGLWVEEPDDNKLEFYKRKQPIHQITGNEMAELIKGRPEYIKPGNTRGSFFLNVYFNDTQIDEVRFSHTGIDTLGFYTDNHSVGYIRDKPKPTKITTSPTVATTVITREPGIPVGLIAGPIYFAVALVAFVGIGFFAAKHYLAKPKKPHQMNLDLIDDKFFYSPGELPLA